MLQRAKKRRVRGSIVLAAIFASAFVLPHNEVLAFHRHSPESPQSYQSRINQSNLQQPELSRPVAHHSRIYQPRAYRSRAARPPVHYSYWRDHDPLLRLLPLGVALLTIAGIHYYYHQERDVYYRQAPSGYITVPTADRRLCEDPSHWIHDLLCKRRQVLLLWRRLLPEGAGGVYRGEPSLHDPVFEWCGRTFPRQVHHRHALLSQPSC